MYHKPKMCRTCLQMSRGDFKFVNLDGVDPLWESNSPNLKDQLIYVIPEMKLDKTEAYICTSCFIALRTAYEFKRMCQVTEQKFQNYNYKYRRPFGVGPGSPQFHVSLSENRVDNALTANVWCQNINYLQSDTSIDITEHHLYDASKVLPRKQLTYLNNVTQKLPEIDVEVVVNQSNADKHLNAEKQLNVEKKVTIEKPATVERSASVEKQAVQETAESNAKNEKEVPENIEKDIDKQEEIAENNISREDKKEDSLTKDLKLDPKSGNITLLNLPGIEIVPRKLDSTAIRRKYNIGSQISILKTPKTVSPIDVVLKKACEEISYLKSNNILPEALNCSVHIECLSSEVAMKNTKEMYSLEEMKTIANSYYSECTDDALICKLCNRFFSTSYWLKIHEEEHANQKVSNCTKCSANFMDNISLEDHMKQHTTEIEVLSETLNVTATNAIESVSKDTSIDNITLLGNDQISLTPIRKKKYKAYTDTTVKKLSSEQQQTESSISTETPDQLNSVTVTEDNGQQAIIMEGEGKLQLATSHSPSPCSPSGNDHDSAIDDDGSRNMKTSNKIKLLKCRIKRAFKKKLYALKYVRKYVRCLICTKLCISKVCLNQHRKYVHVSNTLDSNYWLNFKLDKINRVALLDVKKEVKGDVDDCSDDFESSEIHYLHARTAKSNRTSTFACNICGKRVAEQRFLDLHMFVHTPTFVSMDPNIISNKHGDVFRCYLCEKAFPKERYLKLHNLQVHLTKTIICKICNREFKSDFWYSQHKCIVPTEAPPKVEEPVEDENNQFPCTVCDRKFTRLRFMKSHRHRMHKDVNEDGTPKKSIKRETFALSKSYVDSDDNDDSNYESEIEYDDLEPKESKPLESSGLGDRALSLSEITSRRSASRGVPKLQCDFCGDYIEETVYDKHIFEHNKLRLDRSLSKRKSLESSVTVTPEKHEYLTCPVCSKPFKRQRYLNIHLSKFHEDYKEPPAKDEGMEKCVTNGESGEKEPPEIIYGQISITDGIELYECCERTFKLKAHFYRHFKIKHPDCIFKPIYVEQTPPMDNKNVLEPIITIKEDLNDKYMQISEQSNLEENLQSVSQNFNAAEDLFQDDVCNPEQKEIRKRGRRRKMDALLIEQFEQNTDFTDYIALTEEQSSKRQKILQMISDDKSAITAMSDDSEDMEATAHHLRQLDLLPVVNKSESGRYECHICEKRFKQKCQLRDHFNVHTGDKPYKCDFCNPVRGFTQSSSLYVHIRRVHAVVMENCVWEVYSKNGSCVICSDVFDKHSYMFQHLKDYYVKKGFECQECHLKLHMSCHYKLHDINPEEMQHLLAEQNLDMDDDEESEIEPDSILETMMLPDIDDQLYTDSDSSTIDASGCDESTPLSCTKCDKFFPNKEQLRFHKKSLAHMQQIETIRDKVSEKLADEIEEDLLQPNTEAIADIENGVKAMIRKIRTFKRHNCNLCSASFVKRIHLKKHKRKHRISKAFLKPRNESNMDKSENIEMQDSNTNTMDSSSSIQMTETDKKILDVSSNDLDNRLSQLKSPVELVDKVPADTEIISITTPSEENEKVKPHSSSKVVALSQLSENKRDDEFGSFDVILKIAESTSDLNKQFLFKHTNTNSGVNLDISKCSSTSNFNLTEDLSSHNTIIELPESTITYINPNHSDVSLSTTSHLLRDEDKNQGEMPELDFTIEVSKCTDIPISIDNNQSDYKKSCNFNVDEILLEINESNELSSGNIDKNFYSTLSNDLVILPISENIETAVESSPINDLSFHIVESLAKDTTSALTILDLKTSNDVSKEQSNLETSISQLEIHEVDSTFPMQPTSTVSDKCLDLGD